jgi:hypothetical protein
VNELAPGPEFVVNVTTVTHVRRLCKEAARRTPKKLRARPSVA